MKELPTLRIREWSRITPETGDGLLLRGLTLSDADRELLNELSHYTSLRVLELRQGLLIEVGPHIGTITLSGLRIVILPKLRLDNLLRMVAYAFELPDLALTPTPSHYAPADCGLADLLGLALLKAVERIARGGLLARYREVREDLAAPRGRIQLRHAATRPGGSRLRCTFDELSSDHLLNQVLAGGLRLAAQVVGYAELRRDLARTAERLFADHTSIRLDARTLRSARASLDRRSSHYETALSLVALIFQGSRLGEYDGSGDLPLSGFLLNMNQLFERFLTRYLQEQAPAGVQVIGQEVRADAFAYLENPGGWRQPLIRPDLVFRRRGRPFALGDAKYKNRLEQPPSTLELYQLTTYGLSYPLPEPREVMLFYPLGPDQPERSAQLLFAPGATRERVRIRLVGVPIEALLLQKDRNWWPFACG